MALIKMRPDQANAIWNVVAPGIQVAVPPTANQSMETMTNILAQILRGEIVLWMITESYEADLKKNRLYGHVTTVVNQDWASKVRNLVIYSLYSWEKIPDAIIKAAAEVMKDYARGLGCSRIIALTDEPRVEEMALMVGGKSTHRLIEIPLTNVQSNGQKIGQIRTKQHA